MILPGLLGGLAASALFFWLTWWLLRRDEEGSSGPGLPVPAIPAAPLTAGPPSWWYTPPALDYGRDSTQWQLLVAGILDAVGEAA